MDFGTNLETMRCTDIRTIDPASLRDISDVQIDTCLSKAERIKNYI